MDSWAYKLGPTVGATGPTSFSGFDWSFGAINCSDGSITTQTSSCPYPFCGLSPPPPALVLPSPSLSHFSQPRLPETILSAIYCIGETTFIKNQEVIVSILKNSAILQV